MTIDKIKIYMEDSIFNFWTVKLKSYEIEKQIECAENSYNKLKKEIENGILTDIRYIAELELLKKLLKK